MSVDDGLQVFTLRNGHGLEARFSSYGARWLAMYVPDRHGRTDDVLLGFDDVAAYRIAHEQYYGTMVGRVCGRIGGASFESGGQVYELAANDIYGYPKRNHLHGWLISADGKLAPAGRVAQLGNTRQHTGRRQRIGQREAPLAADAILWNRQGRCYTTTPPEVQHSIFYRKQSASRQQLVITLNNPVGFQP